jgi:hypothetical protein
MPSRSLAYALLLSCFVVTSAVAQTQRDVDTNAEIRDLKQLVLQLQSRVADLEKKTGAALPEPAVSPTVAGGTLTSSATGAPTQAAVQEQNQPASQTQLTTDDRKILDYLKGTTINVGVDGYYDYNFNAPVGRVNLLRAYDVLSNNFSLNQASVIFDRPPEVESGRRYGARLDLQFGQATSTLQGNSTNEPRPDIYENIFQAYGTYVVPLGTGLTVDFGKWASSLGIEGNYTKDQMNYSRSYWFNFLPFYHMGLRANYKVNNKFALNYWVVNGTNQTEATNAFKDELFGFVVTPRKTISWTVNYYYGQDHPDRAVVTLPTGVSPTVSSTIPIPVQPGLTFTAIQPAPDGRTHIFDTYVNWQATPKLTLAVEGDYEIQRLWKNTNLVLGQSSAPSHVIGGAGYAQYRFAPKMAIAARAEYLSDRGGLFSGLTQALKETTLTFDYNLAANFLMRYEWRRDFSNQPSFLTSTQGVLSNQQNTATVGLIWWYGRKEGAW